MNSGQERVGIPGIPGMVGGDPVPAFDVQKRTLYPMMQLM